MSPDTRCGLYKVRMLVTICKAKKATGKQAKKPQNPLKLTI